MSTMCVPSRWQSPGSWNTYTQNTEYDQVNHLHLKDTKGEMQVPLKKGFCFFKIRVLKRCFIKPTFPNLTAYAIKDSPPC